MPRGHFLYFLRFDCFAFSLILLKNWGLQGKVFFHVEAFKNSETICRFPRDTWWIGTKIKIITENYIKGVYWTLSRPWLYFALQLSFSIQRKFLSRTMSAFVTFERLGLFFIRHLDKKNQSNFHITNFALCIKHRPLRGYSKLNLFARNDFWDVNQIWVSTRKIKVWPLTLMLIFWSKTCTVRFERSCSVPRQKTAWVSQM